ncbi:MAG: zinc ribbon domain-containing protein [bacterium]|jgi:putative FmdB family regulatory protein|nr:zinc ribbon domain-containing protein [bacterium]
MPTYEYSCQACGHALEAFQPMTAEPLHDCPVCGAPSLRRLISRGAGMIFKGTGFHATDYRKGGPAGGKEGGECPVADGKPEAKPAGCGGGCACHGGQ